MFHALNLFNENLVHLFLLLLLLSLMPLAAEVLFPDVDDPSDNFIDSVLCVLFHMFFIALEFRLLI